MATGHYARRGHSRRWRDRREADAASDATRTGYRLLRGRDQNKDQSYFLYGLGQSELACTLFPLGDMTKPQVRDAARALGLATAEKRDSQEICFVPRGNYRDVLRERSGWQAEPGPLIDVDGRRVGEHFGAAGYTVGQRQGPGHALGEPRYVWKIDPAPTSSSSAGERTWKRDGSNWKRSRSSQAWDRVATTAVSVPRFKFDTGAAPPQRPSGR